ncbi:TorF family putative porin [Sandaracinobacteroides sp. A072]|uniref:TorF family putative porin n=1 Tax=Sandaracinobacteroides sp. A072 TaxID=3461146 RepID=UPI0040438F90
MKFNRSILLAAPIAAMLLPAGMAKAQDSGVEISGSVDFVSDYRFRGVSFSDLDPAIQGSITVSTAPGFFVGLWGSSIADFNGSTTEIDATLGWAGSLGGLDTSIGVVGYLYPGGTDTDIVEFFGTVGTTVGPVGLELGLSWAPSQNNLDGSSRYLYGAVNAGIPNTPITLKASLGHEQGSLVFDEADGTTKKLDWMLGADIVFEPLTLGVAYVGTDYSRDRIFLPGGDSFRANRAGRDGIVVTLSAAF